MNLFKRAQVMEQELDWEADLCTLAGHLLVYDNRQVTQPLWTFISLYWNEGLYYKIPKMF